MKNKYGPRNKEAADGNNHTPAGTNNDTAGGSKQLPTSSRFSRSKSIGVSGNNASNGRRNSEDAGKENPSSGLITSSSRHQYMQKRKVVIKFGTRGSEAGSFTWPRGVAVGPDNSIVVRTSEREESLSLNSLLHNSIVHRRWQTVPITEFKCSTLPATF